MFADSPVRMLIFDLDGTLFDTAPGIGECVNQLLEHHGKTRLEAEQVMELIGGGSPPLVNRLIEQYFESTASHQELLVQFHDIYAALYLETHHSPLYPGVMDFLKAWPHLLAIASNKRKRFVEGLVKHQLKEFPWFRLYGGDSFEQQKPDPIQLLTIIRESGLQPHQCVMVGDSGFDVRAAHAAGVRVVALDFGYGSAEEWAPFTPDAVISHFSELGPAISKMR